MKPALNLEALPKLYAAVREYLRLVEVAGRSRENEMAAAFLIRDRAFYEMQKSLAACEKQEGEFLTCDVCGEKSENVRMRIDPYIQEISGDIVECCLCDDCFQNKLDDI